MFQFLMENKQLRHNSTIALSFILVFFFFFISDEAIDKETFLSLEESGNLSVLIPKMGPRVKFRKRLREYLEVKCYYML